jgi:hypothetical protein
VDLRYIRGKSRSCLRRLITAVLTDEVLTVPVTQWFPTSGRDPNQGRWVSDLGSPEAFMKYCKIFSLKFYAKYPYVQYITNLLNFNFCISFNISNVTSFIYNK